MTWEKELLEWSRVSLILSRSLPDQSPRMGFESAILEDEFATSRAGHTPGWRRCWGVLRGLANLPADLLWFPFTAANPLLCSTARYHCKNGLCIDKSFICDGQNNCQDNSDEESCESSQGRSPSSSKKNNYDTTAQ